MTLPALLLCVMSMTFVPVKGTFSFLFGLKTNYSKSFLAHKSVSVAIRICTHATGTVDGTVCAVTRALGGVSFKPKHSKVSLTREQAVPPALTQLRCFVIDSSLVRV